MRSIVHVIDNIGLGGAQTMLFELYYAINKHFPDYDQKLIVLSDRCLEKEFVSSYNVPFLLKDIKGIEKIISSLKKPIIFYHILRNSRSYSYKILDIIRNKFTLPIIAISHTFGSFCLLPKLGNLDCFVFVCKRMKKDYKHSVSYYNKDLKTVVIRNGANSDRYEKIQPKERKKDYFLTGRINRICRWKHSNSWLEWCSKVKLNKRMRHEYIGAGIRGSEKVSKDFVKNLSHSSINKVKMLGKVKNFNKKISIIKSWDVFLYETNNPEGISMAILEALACGVPVVCSNHYGNKEIIENGINGYVFKGRNEAKDILNDLCNNKDKLETLKKTTKEHFKNNLNGNIWAKKYIDLVNTL